MNIDPIEGCEALRQVVSLLDRAKMKYWIGRGVFRQFVLHGNFGDQQRDIDIHVLRDDQQPLFRLTERLQSKGYVRISSPLQTHKITLRRKDGLEVEFVYLERDGDRLWHQAGYPEKRRFECPATVFRDREIELCGLKIRAPEDAYCEHVYGLEWRKEERGSGGRPML
jgi:hypothetical protein